MPIHIQYDFLLHAMHIIIIHACTVYEQEFVVLHSQETACNSNTSEKLTIAMHKTTNSEVKLCGSNATWKSSRLEIINEVNSRVVGMNNSC